MVCARVTFVHTYHIILRYEDRLSSTYMPASPYPGYLPNLYWVAVFLLIGD